METNKKCYNLEDLIQSLGGKTDLTKAIENVLKDEKKSGIKQDEEKLTNDEIKGAMDFVSSLIFGNESKREKTKNIDRSHLTMSESESKQKDKQSIKNGKEMIFDSVEDLYKYISNKNNESNTELDQKIEESEKKLANDMVRRSKEEAGTLGDKTSYKRIQKVENKEKLDGEYLFKGTGSVGNLFNFNPTGGASGIGKPISSKIKEQFKKGDKVRIIKGDYKALSDKECNFIDYCKGMNKVLLQLDELNPIYVNPEDIELVKPKTIQYYKNIRDRVSNRVIKVQVFQNNFNKFINVCLSNNNNNFIQEKFEEEKDICKLIEKAYYKLMKSFYERELI